MPPKGTRKRKTPAADPEPLPSPEPSASPEPVLKKTRGRPKKTAPVAAASPSPSLEAEAEPVALPSRGRPKKAPVAAPDVTTASGSSARAVTSNGTDKKADSKKPAKKTKPADPAARVNPFDVGFNTEHNHTDSEEDDAGPQSWSVPLPVARDAGDVEYRDETIHPNTFLFLADLKKNNQREWLKWNDADFRASQTDFETFVAALTPKIVAKDPTVLNAAPKKLIFRIYRDIRFSPDPTPYKTHFSAAFSHTGRKGPYAGYYVQFAPGGNSFIGGGLWCPPAAPLVLIRTDIDRDGSISAGSLKGSLMDPRCRKVFFKDVKGKGKAAEEQVLQKFIEGNKEGMLKTCPKGWPKDHVDIDLLKLKNFTLGVKLTDEEVLGRGVRDTVLGIMEGLVPWVTYLNSVVMP